MLSSPSPVQAIYIYIYILNQLTASTNLEDQNIWTPLIYILRGKNKYTGSYFYICHRMFAYVHTSLIP